MKNNNEIFEILKEISKPRLCKIENIVILTDTFPYPSVAKTFYESSLNDFLFTIYDNQNVWFNSRYYTKDIISKIFGITISKFVDNNHYKLELDDSEKLDYMLTYFS